MATVQLPNQESFAIIALVAEVTRGEFAQKILTAQLRTFCQQLGVSSVYKRERSADQKNSELVVALKVSSFLPKKELVNRLSELHLKEAGASAETILLTLNHDVWMHPGGSLPDLRLAKDRLFLRCAAEVWGDYEHPILAKTLTELVKLYPALDTIEFFAQGTYLY
jgi:hypothetical protein